MIKPTVLSRICYVLITENADKRAHSRNINWLLLSKLPFFLSHLLDELSVSLVYFRRFDCTIDAIEHQRLLQGSEATAVNRVISQMNPEWENLTEQLIDQLTTQPLYKDKER